MSTLVRRLRAALSSDRDHGFVLLDVLIGIAVLALLLLTAIQSIGPMRQRSYQSSTQSDARQVATAITGALTDKPSLSALSLPSAEAALTTAHLDTLGVNLSSGVSVARYAPLGGDDFALCTVHQAGSTPDAYTLYDSRAGRITGTSRGNGDCQPTESGASVPTTPPFAAAAPGAPSAPVEDVAADLNAPRNLLLTDLGGGQVRATWSAAVPNWSDGYQVYLDGVVAQRIDNTVALRVTLTGVSPGAHTVEVTQTRGTQVGARVTRTITVS